MTASIWQKPATVEGINQQHRGTICEHLGIHFVEVGPDYLVARMPADGRTKQPAGIVHGGASVTLAETLGSVGAHLSVGDGFTAVGLEVNANHIRSVRGGAVTGRAHAVHRGRTTQIWQIEMRDDEGRLTCTSRLTMAVIEKPAAR